ncbi:MAG: MoaD/ThiS family protein [Candidatus Thermoplasmatota archaeon]|nr:MoaD/ThiS family protein [Candidatus Thermoplasmatota archaeon]
MKIKVKFFSAHREVVGKKEIEIELKEKTGVNEMLKMLMNDYPKLRKLMDSTILSLNHNRANGTELLKDGDEVALCPPVGGG